MFGVSEANATSDIFGPTSPAGKLYQKLTGHTIPPETDGNYSELVEIFDMLQAAGPDLTPQNMARGIHALPVLGRAHLLLRGLELEPRARRGQAGAGEHTALIDARFVWWDANAISPVNGMKGTLRGLDNGHRSGIGQWPKTMPAVFTSSSSRGRPSMRPTSATDPTARVRRAGHAAGLVGAAAARPPGDHQPVGQPDLRRAQRAVQPAGPGPAPPRGGLTELGRPHLGQPPRVLRGLLRRPSEPGSASPRSTGT